MGGPTFLALCAKEQSGLRALGSAGEGAIARWYERSGFVILDRNWQCPWGEIDLICARAGLLVICEVKTRRSTSFGSAGEAVGWDKQRRLRRLAARWLSERGPELRWRARRPGARPVERAMWSDIRFDVATVTAGRVEVVEGAF